MESVIRTLSYSLRPRPDFRLSYHSQQFSKNLKYITDDRNKCCNIIRIDDPSSARGRSTAIPETENSFISDCNSI